MTPFRPVSLMLAFLALGPVCASAQVRVRVIGDRVNLRAAAGGTPETVAQANRGDILIARTGLDGEWVEVDAPAGSPVWVYGELVKDSVVLASKVRVRGGPGINYKPIGRLEKDDRVTVLAREGDWLRIAPPPGTTLWISRQYVEPVDPLPAPAAPSEPAPAVPPPAAPAPAEPAATNRPDVVTGDGEPAPVRRSPEEVRVALPGGRREPAPAPVPRPAAPAVARVPAGIPADRLVASKPQGQIVSYRGIVRTAGFVLRRPSRFRLVEADSDRGATMCFVLGNDEQLAEILGHDVSIQGREYWVQGVRDPVVVPERISRHD